MTVVWFRSPSGSASRALSTSACDAPASSGAGGAGGAPRRPCAYSPIDATSVTITIGTKRFMIASRGAFYADCPAAVAGTRHRSSKTRNPAKVPRMSRDERLSAPSPYYCGGVSQTSTMATSNTDGWSSRWMRRARWVPAGVVCTACFAVSTAGSASAAQVIEAARRDPTVLLPQQPIERELTPGEEHRYQLALQAGECVRVIVEQLGIDVVVRVSDVAAGAPIADVQDEITSRGQES